MTLPIPLPCAGDDCSEELPIRPEHASNFEGRAWYCPACARALATSPTEGDDDR